MTTESNPTNNQLPSWRSWMAIARVSALPSAISNVLMGFLLANQTWFGGAWFSGSRPAVDLILILLSSSCLYLAGMILNDVFDVEVDSIERPSRPIPSGAISKHSATLVGSGLLIGGVAFAALISLVHRELCWLPICIAVALAICIVLYDGALKKTLAAPVLMGSCRTLNILLAASTAVAEPLAAGQSAATVLGFPLIVWWVAISMGIYIAGVTLLARRESGSNPSSTPLMVAACILIFGLVGLALVTYCPTPIKINAGLTDMYPLLLGLIALPIIRHVFNAVFARTPKAIQSAIITCLRSIIILDAALCFLVAPDQPIYAIIVISLLIPATFLGRLVSST